MAGRSRRSRFPDPPVAFDFLHRLRLLDPHERMLRGPDDLKHHPVPRLFRHDKEHVVRLERSRVTDRNEIFRQRFLPVFVVLAPTLKPPNAIARPQRLPTDRLNNPPKEAVRIFRPVSRVDEKVIYLSIGSYSYRQQYLREIRNMQIRLYLHFST